MKRIVLDPGHDSDDSGSIQQDGELERDYTLRLALAVKEALLLHEVEVLFTHMGEGVVEGDDLDAELRGRANVANESKAAFLLSLHHNAGPAKARGAEIYIWTDKRAPDGGLAWLNAVDNHKAPLSFRIVKDMLPIIRDTLASLGIPWRGAPQQIMCADFGILRYTDLPCALLETHFGTNKEDDDIADSPKFIPRLAAGIAKSLVVALNLAERPQPRDPNAVTVLVDGVVTECGARLENGKVRVELRPLAENIGARVGWNQSTRTVNVSSNRHPR